MLVRCALGHETFRNPDRGIRITAGWRRYPHEVGDSITTAARDSLSGVTLRSSNQTPASNVNPAHGVWTDFEYDFAPLDRVEGGIIDVQVWRGDELFVIFLRLREHAPLVNVGIGLTNHERALRSWVGFEGRFDIINLSEYESMDLALSPLRGITYLSREDIDSSTNFRYRVLEAGQEYIPPPTVQVTTVSGRTVTMNTRSRRRINLRRPQN